MWAEYLHNIWQQLYPLRHQELGVCLKSVQKLLFALWFICKVLIPCLTQFLAQKFAWAGWGALFSEPRQSKNLSFFNWSQARGGSQAQLHTSKSKDWHRLSSMVKCAFSDYLSQLSVGAFISKDGYHTCLHLITSQVMWVHASNLRGCLGDPEKCLFKYMQLARTSARTSNSLM